jgi:hypothetical protein
MMEMLIPFIVFAIAAAVLALAAIHSDPDDDGW